MYSKGQGVPQDRKAAIKWYKLAAKQGHANAQFNLGVAYYYGEDIVQDYKSAFNLFEQVAEQGYAVGGVEGIIQFQLGLMYANGEGVIQDYTRAHMWWNIAASLGDKDAIENRDMVAKEMTPEDISKAQSMARECVAKNYKGC